MSAAVSAPTITPTSQMPKKTDPATGFLLSQYPIALSASSPLLASGAPLTSASAPYTIDPTTAQNGFTYGALVYAVAGSNVWIFDGSGNWIPETSFDPTDPSLKPTAFAFDQTSGAWTAVVVLSTIQAAIPSSSAQGFTLTNPVGGTPKYGFVGLFTTPKTSATTAVRSALGTPFGVAGANSSQRVQPGLLIGTTPTQNAQNADGFEIVVMDASQSPAAELLLSGSLAQAVTIQCYAGGVARASVTLSPSGQVTVSAANGITLDAPQITVTGTLEAQNISYVPYGGSGETFL
ncbi:MAG TPA: hypothetical protein VME66_09190 [Candidatus Acidoferrales bacterium]|nr:hypothetical protein [Candidatus Acidoferrales bacterium]